MTTPPRIVIDRQTSRAEHDRLVNVARTEAKRRKRAIRIMRVLIAVGAAVAVVAAFLLGVAVVAGAM